MNPTHCILRICGGWRGWRDDVQVHFHAFCSYPQNMGKHYRHSTLRIKLCSSLSRVCHSSIVWTHETTLSHPSPVAAPPSTTTRQSLQKNASSVPLTEDTMLSLAVNTVNYASPATVACSWVPTAHTTNDRFCFLSICLVWEGDIWIQCQAQSQTVHIFISKEFSKSMYFITPSPKAGIRWQNALWDEQCTAFWAKTCLNRDSCCQPLYAVMTFNASNKEYAGVLLCVWHRAGNCDDGC